MINCTRYLHVNEGLVEFNSDTLKQNRASEVKKYVTKDCFICCFRNLLMLLRHSVS